MSAEETNKEVIVAKAVTASIIWLPNRSVESHFATEIRPNLHQNKMGGGEVGGEVGGERVVIPAGRDLQAAAS